MIKLSVAGIFSFIFSCFSTLHSAPVQDRLLICGICKNIEHSFLNSALSATQLGEQFLDYRIVIYENNSTDTTKQLLQAWSFSNPRVTILSEDLPQLPLASILYNRIESIARARNHVMDLIMEDSYADYKYVVWADLDFLEPWDNKHIIETILYPQEEWDAVLANGSYDLFAFRDAQFPIGFELIGPRYWQHIEEIRSRFHLSADQGWQRVYSAFGGLGIYKRDAIKGCRYSAFVTPDLEDYVVSWLTDSQLVSDTPLLNQYIDLLTSAPRIQLNNQPFYSRNEFPVEIGVQIKDNQGQPQITWFSCVPYTTWPFTCEHINFHAAMAAQGHDKIFINPSLISNHPSN